MKTSLLLRLTPEWRLDEQENTYHRIRLQDRPPENPLHIRAPKKPSDHLSPTTMPPQSDLVGVSPETPADGSDEVESGLYIGKAIVWF